MHLTFLRFDLCSPVLQSARDAAPCHLRCESTVHDELKLANKAKQHLKHLVLTVQWERTPATIFRCQQPWWTFISGVYALNCSVQKGYPQLRWSWLHPAEKTRRRETGRLSLSRCAAKTAAAWRPNCET
ncbi:unnamed protein product [Ixodes pacificus]